MTTMRPLSYALCLLAAASSLRAAEPVLWLDTGNAQTLVLGEEQVREWKDAAGRGVVLVQPKVDHRPEPRDKLNGRTTLYFDGKDFLSGPAALKEGDDTFTFIVLWRPSRSGVQAVFEQSGQGTGRRASLLQVNEAYGFNGQSNDAHKLVPVTPNEWRLTVMVVNGELKNNVVIFDNGAPPVVGTIDIVKQNVGVDGIRVGNKLISNNEFFQGDLAEIRVFDSALSTAEVVAEMSVVKQRWALDFTLPTPAAVAEVKAPAMNGPNLKPTAAQVEFFENKVRPVLAESCFRCHGEDEDKRKAGLRLDGLAHILTGGDSGSAIIPNDPEKSLVIESIRYKNDDTAMPPKKKLRDEQIAALTEWVAMGAPWPGFDPEALALAAKKEAEPYDWELFRKDHWSFRPIADPQPPTVKNSSWPKNDIDRFVLARMETAGVAPNEQADKRTLIRRAYLDLIGLPPTPEQVSAFLADEGPQAFEKVVDELLQSSHYGERWARHWLDVARYSDGFGSEFGNDTRLEGAWRYRDWVVAALNRDMGYDEFVKHQIAGDVLKGDRDPVATGFFAVGPTYQSDGGDAEAKLNAEAETLSDRVDTFSRAFLGLTVACARCHDHKFDPITQRDYYAIAGVFRNSPVGEYPLASQPEIEAYQKAQERVKEATKLLTEQKKKKQPTKELQAALDAAQKASPPKYAFAHVIKESGKDDMHLALRGNLAKPGELVQRRFLEIVAGKEAATFKEGSGRRELAEAVVHPANPLTARVMVNRVWDWHFGQALSRTPSNFGVLGEAPTHPLLLDWLAQRFMKSGWSLKKLHRDILLSATWQMSSRFDEQKFAKDGDNRLIWRMNPRKLEAETWRDSLLAVTGELDSKLGGESTDSIMDSPRRSLYATISRSGDRLESDAFFRLFDFPVAQATAEKRTTTTVPQQYLFMMNNPFMTKRASALVKALQGIEGDQARIDAAYERLYGRAVTAAEVEAGMDFLSGHPERWIEYAQVLLSAHELIQIQ
jgi:cytochrome c553